MKSFIAALRSLVLPFGATTGTRLELDGISGTIRGFDADDNLVFELDGTDATWGQLPTGSRVEIDGDNGVINVYDGSNTIVAMISEDGLEITNPFSELTTVISAGTEGEAGSTPISAFFNDPDKIPSSTHETPSITPHSTNDFEIRCVFVGQVPEFTSSFTPPSTYTERADLDSGYENSKSFAALATKELTSGSPTGQQIFNSSLIFETQAAQTGFTVAIGSASGSTASFRSITTATPSGGTSVTVNKPTGATEGDILVAFVCDVKGTGDSSLLPPAGWSLLRNIQETLRDRSDITLQSQCWWRPATSSEPVSYTFTGSTNAGNAIGMIVCVQNADIGTAAEGGIVFGEDTNLYRSAANTLRTDDSLSVGEDLTVGNDATVSGDLGVAGTATTGALTSTSLSTGAISSGEINAAGDINAVGGSIEAANDVIAGIGDSVISTFVSIREGGDLSIQQGFAARTYPRGLTSNVFHDIGNDSARSTGVNTDMGVTFETIENRWYRIHAFGQYNVSVNGVYAINISIGGSIGVNNGNVIGRLTRDTITGTGYFNGSMLWLATDSVSNTFRVRNDGGSAGSITFVANVDIPRQLWVEDVGDEN